MPLPASLTVDELKQRVDKVLDADDELLAELLEAAYEQAKARPPFGCGRLLEPDPAADSDPPVAKRVLAHGSRFVRVPDARQITSVDVDGAATAGYEPIEQNGVIVKLELLAPANVVVVTGRFGFSEIPVLLRDAIYTLAARSWTEREAQYADQVVVGEGAPVQYYRQLPPRTKLVFQTFTVLSDLYGLT